MEIQYNVRLRSTIVLLECTKLLRTHLCQNVGTIQKNNHTNESLI